MALPVKMRKRGAWPGVSPEVQSAFVDVEKNAADAIDAVVVSRRPAWSPNAVNVGTYQAQPWDLVIANGTCTILLPIPSPSNRGAEIAVAKTGAYTIVVQPISGLVDGSAASSGPGSSQATVFISSGEGWHSA